MPAGKAFLDSNVLLYLLSEDTSKADRAEAIVQAETATINVQVLNEITNVARRKIGLSWSELDDVLSLIRSVCPVEPLTIEVHDRGRALAQRHSLSIYDAMIVAAAIEAGCSTLYSEDMQHGLHVDGGLRIVNPFR